MFTLLKKNNISFNENSTLPSVSGIGGDQSILGKILSISFKYENHICKTDFYIVDLPSHFIILAIDWLFAHTQTIKFITKDLSLKSNQYIVNCLLTPSSFTAHISSSPTPTSSKEKELATVDKILRLLLDLLLPYMDVFDEGSANMLPPPHQQYDCKIKQSNSNLTLSYTLVLSTRLRIQNLSPLWNIH